MEIRRTLEKGHPSPADLNRIRHILIFFTAAGGEMDSTAEDRMGSTLRLARSSYVQIKLFGCNLSIHDVAFSVKRNSTVGFLLLLR